MATKSLLIAVKVDQALKAHNCQANARHRIVKGDQRLKVKNERSWDHYCMTCAQTIVARDIAKLATLQQQLLAIIDKKSVN